MDNAKTVASRLRLAAAIAEVVADNENCGCTLTIAEARSAADIIEALHNKNAVLASQIVMIETALRGEGE